jgi:hypothetical protein
MCESIPFRLFRLVLGFVVDSLDMADRCVFAGRRAESTILIV